MWGITFAGFCVYQYAQLLMLEFYYDYLDNLIEQTDFQMCEMHKDSFNLALNKTNTQRGWKTGYVQITLPGIWKMVPT